jgi:sRNA-binding protein
MFGALMGTLTSFQKQSSRDSKSVFEKRAEIDARVKEKVAKEKEELAAEKERTDKERKEKEDQLKGQLEIETVMTPWLWSWADCRPHYRDL